jgi:hypothetical protein
MSSFFLQADILMGRSVLPSHRRIKSCQEGPWALLQLHSRESGNLGFLLTTFVV